MSTETDELIIRSRTSPSPVAQEQDPASATTAATSTSTSTHEHSLPSSASPLPQLFPDIPTNTPANNISSLHHDTITEEKRLEPCVTTDQASVLAPATATPLDSLQAKDQVADTHEGTDTAVNKEKRVQVQQQELSNPIAKSLEEASSSLLSLDGTAENTTTPPPSKATADPTSTPSPSNNLEKTTLSASNKTTEDPIAPPHLSINTSPLLSPSNNTSSNNTPRTTSYIPPKSTPSSPPTLPPPQQQSSVQNLLSCLIGKPTEVSAEAAMAGGKSMFFSTNAVQRRRNMANTSALTEHEADLTSRDRARQKEAIRRFLDEKIDDEWKFKWPRPENEKPLEFVDELGKSGREAERWKERDEWLSNTNDSDDDPAMPTAASPDTVSIKSPFTFESPDDVAEVIKRRELARKRRRERKLNEELEYNDGLKCFVQRRDAWTGARHVPRHIAKAPSKALSIASATDGETNETDGSDDDDSDGYLSEDIEIPVAPALIPSSNTMRRSITPASYNTIYDKVVLQHLAPACPMNLQDMINSCVHGWKRDGEWPPKGTAPEPLVAKKKGRKLSVATIFGLQKTDSREKEKEKEKEADKEGGIRKSFQKFLSLGKDKDINGANTNGVKSKDDGVSAAA